jgi:hypothetical protein
VTRSVTVPDKEDLPSGNYGFVELYCNDPNCDCRRVVIVVLRPHTGWKFWAVINYGWESVVFYQKWAKAPASDHSGWQGLELDPLSEQGPYALVLLNLFMWALESPDVQRLKKHYHLFGTAVDEEFAKRSPTLLFPRGSAR